MAGRLAFSAGLSALIVVELLVHQTCSAEDGHQCAPSSCGNIHNISNPFRLQDDPKNCGDRRYTLSCENNNTVLYLDAGKHYVRQINYDNYTIRVVNSGIDQVSIPRYFLNGNNFSFGYSHDLDRLRSVVFMMCENRVNSPLYLETSTCFSINGSDSEYSSNSSKTYRYVKVGRTEANGCGGLVPNRRNVSDIVARKWWPTCFLFRRPQRIGIWFWAFMAPSYVWKKLQINKLLLLGWGESCSMFSTVLIGYIYNSLALLWLNL
jgi:hypothetical protein